MRRITLTVTCVLLAIPAAAFGKTGIEFSTPPEAKEVGKDNNFNIALFREPRDPTGEPAPMSGVRPLVTFRSKSGRVVRVRGHVVNGEGFSNGNVVRFPDSGPWQIEIKAGGKTLPSEQFPDGITAGGGILDSQKALDASKPHPVPGHTAAADDGNGTLWILLGLAAALGTMSIVAIRTGIPGRVRGLLGGGA